MSPRRSSGFLLTALLVLIALLVAFGPPERVLGVHVRVVYLHGAWVWTALAGFAAAATTGAAGLILRRRSLQSWSESLGRSATFFWVTYLPISLIAMQSNWNGLFLAEPRWRIGLNFAVAAVLLQVGLAVLARSAWASGMNVAFLVALVWSLANAQQVMHPSSPIFSSPSPVIQGYFVALLLLCLLAGWQATRWLHPSSS
jgi:hypothetical protein